MFITNLWEKQLINFLPAEYSEEKRIIINQKFY
ncbi:hypothetical protein KKC1_04300 [Calderihabitans maritimus]|uniref:Uncharacterized protein n=1 Tax=Calderihabitans maritimus TaxID=1246530 RepID=A0A1Z5HPA0_9FIRM|nr:hypothetical protein KKC1_04300 [Calderihabitans maritimus]